MRNGDAGMAYDIRSFDLKDAEAIRELSRDELGYDFPLEETKKNLALFLESEDNQIYVAIIDDKVVGYIHACTYEVIYAPPMKNIMGIAVAKAHRQKGIGRALLEKMEDWAKEEGAYGIRLVSGAWRTDAHTFYQHCGYERKKKQYNFHKIFEEE